MTSPEPRPAAQGPGEESQAFVWLIKLLLMWPARGLLAPRWEQPAGLAALRRGCTWCVGLGYRKAEHEKETFQADGVQ